jgi:hypothetical protein
MLHLSSMGVVYELKHQLPPFKGIADFCRYRCLYSLGCVQGVGEMLTLLSIFWSLCRGGLLACIKILLLDRLT